MQIFAEYAPITLLWPLWAFKVGQFGHCALLEFFCGCQVFSCFGISSLQAHGKFRVTGMVGTFTTIAVSAPWLLNAYLIAL
jgi:hypothetical protein